MARKPLRHAEQLKVIYDNARWSKLRLLRSRAIALMRIFEENRLQTITHGSIARGDVTAKSDVDLFVPTQASSFSIETILERANIEISRRVIVQATPYYAAKGYLEIEHGQTISFPLVKMRRVEREFYRFSGEIGLKMLEENKRVKGVDKRLMLIEPTSRGHIETSVVGREQYVVSLLGISSETVLDRVHALLRRDKIGRTGVFVQKELKPEETFEMALERLAKSKPEVRRRLRDRAK